MAAFSILPLVQDFIRIPWRVSRMFCSKIDVTKELDVTKKPKKPLNSFQLFKSEIAEKLKKDTPEIKKKEINAIAKELWKNKSEEEKNDYYMSYKSALEEYNKNFVNYLNQDDILKIYKDKKLKKQIIIKRLTDLKKPKRPIPPFFQFLLFHRAQNVCDSVQNNKAFASKMGEKWNEMTESEKKEFKLKYNEDKKEYEKNLTKWEEEMISLGNFDVIRVSTLQKLNLKD